MGEACELAWAGPGTSGSLWPLTPTCSADCWRDFYAAWCCFSSAGGLMEPRPEHSAVIRIGIDDTDIIGSPGTNQLARAIVRDLADRADLVRITRHQLLDDPRVPYTSQNGSASILLTPKEPLRLDEVIAACRIRMLDWFIEGSDPGLCVSDHVPPEVVEWGQCCKTELVTKERASHLAERCGVHLEGLAERTAA